MVTLHVSCFGVGFIGERLLTKAGVAGAVPRLISAYSSPMMTTMEEILRTRRAVVTREPGLIYIRRLPETLLEIGPLEDFAERLLLAVPLRERSTLGLLLDVRDAPMGAGDANEAQADAIALRVYEGFTRVAIVVRTAVGVLQASRRMRSTTIPGQVFDDEAAARAYLLDDSTPARPARSR